MSESRDTAIKLFGKTITSLFRANHDDPLSSPVTACSLGKETSSSSSSSCCPSSFEPDKVKKQIADDNEQDNSSSRDPLISTDLNEEPKAASETSSPRSSKNNGDQHSEVTTVTSASPEKTALKKPDKILPCPRCKSTDTKFCYYNNYNINQPRHFCKNCQRYWTDGGSMRNVPVGSGRRKSKSWASSSNQYLQIDSDDNNKNSATILNFGSSGFMVTDSGKDRSGDAKVTADSASKDVKNYQQGFLAPQVTFPVPPPWPYRWNPAIPNGNFYPLPFYWGCTVPLWSPNTSPCQWKRTRDQTSLGTDRESKDTKRKRSSGVDEPSEATRSVVIRPKLAIRTEKTDKDKLSVLNKLETKVNRSFMPDTALALQANPAALARSMTFHENNSTVNDKIESYVERRSKD